MPTPGRACPAGDNPVGMPTIAVIDFETTGSSPAQGARATEIAAVLVRGGRIVDRFQSLMRSGAWVPPFIEQLTGISNAMLADAPDADAVMHEVARFTEGCPLVAHNAAFDRSFWLAEAARAGIRPDPPPSFACTVRLSRRLYPQAPNHRLGTLAAWHGLPAAGRAHRALADATTTAQLLLRIQHDLAAALHRAAAGDAAHGAPGVPRDAIDRAPVIDHALLCDLQRTPAQQLPRWLARRARPAAPAYPMP